MIAALFKTLGQIGDPPFRKVMGRGLIGALIVFVALLAGLWLTLTYTALFSIGWLEGAIDVLGGAAAFLLSVLLFPAVVSVVIGVFLDDVCRAVEDKHYPGLPAPRVQPMAEIVLETIKFAAVLAAVNLLVLPLYIFFPGGNLLIFYGLNGYLIAREYFDLVAARRLDADRAATLRKANMGYLWAGGALCAFGLTVPVLNWFAPVISTAFMVHLFHRLNDAESRRGGTPAATA